MMETIVTSETSVNYYQAVQRNITEDRHLIGLHIKFKGDNIKGLHEVAAYRITSHVLRVYKYQFIVPFSLGNVRPWLICLMKSY